MDLPRSMNVEEKKKFDDESSKRHKNKKFEIFPKQLISFIAEPKQKTKQNKNRKKKFVFC